MNFGDEFTIFFAEAKRHTDAMPSGGVIKNKKL